MSKLVLDRETAAKFQQLEQGVEVCDESGRILGYFSPRPDPSIYENIEPPISDEELERRANEGGGRTLAEILADLEKRG